MIGNENEKEMSDLKSNQLSSNQSIMNDTLKPTETVSVSVTEIESDMAMDK